MKSRGRSLWHAIIHAEVEELMVRHYVPDALIALLKGIGFSSIRTLKAFDAMSLAEADAEVIVFECRK